jgi:hypothetical protein
MCGISPDRHLFQNADLDSPKKAAPSAQVQSGDLPVLVGMISIISIWFPKLPNGSPLLAAHLPSFVVQVVVQNN